MSKTSKYEVGQILKNSVGQYAKIISIADGRYGLSGWTTLRGATEAETTTLVLNVYGIEACEAEVTTDKASDASDSSGESKKVATTEITLGKYLVTGEVFPLNEDGTPKTEALEINSVHELPTVVGEGFVKESKMVNVSNKSAINKLNAEATKALAVTLGITVAEADTKAIVQEKLYTHFGL